MFARIACTTEYAVAREMQRKTLTTLQANIGRVVVCGVKWLDREVVDVVSGWLGYLSEIHSLVVIWQ
jgi:hypothetical protein